jgi:SAM-dependent methyltransferase
MTDFKQTIVNLLRRTHFLQLADRARYIWELKKQQRTNKDFIEKNPDFPLPPYDLVYDACGHVNLQVFYHSGKEHAQYFSTLIKEHIDNRRIKICEWGCGPARILCHMPYFFEDRSVDFYGFDYNPRTIKWCREHIKTATFMTNLLTPPLSCESDAFDCLYCLSVFTHLSREMHFQWIEELSRVVKSDGLIILTTHGDECRTKLLSSEMRKYDQGKLVVRGNIAEGKRCFVAYQPPSFVRNDLLRNLLVLSHIREPLPLNISQDVWVVQNRKTSSTVHC